MAGPDDEDAAADTALEAGRDAEPEIEPESDGPPIERALRAVRREAFKAAVVYALVDAAVVAVLVTGLVTAVSVPGVPEFVSIPVPSPVSAVFEAFVGTPRGRVPVSGAAVVGIGVAVLTALAALAYRRRRTDPLRQFEAANPEVGEALRTARDTAGDASDDVMARRLYRDVLARLQAADGTRLLDRGRLAIPLVVLLLVAIGATQIAAVGVTIDLPTVGDGERPTDGGQPGDGDGGPGENPGGLGPGREVLGEPTDPPRGERPDDVVIDPGGGSERGDREYETGGFPSGPVDVAAEQAGFAPATEFEDADLVQAYLLEIREDENE